MDEPLFYMPCDRAPEGVPTRLCRECKEYKPLHLFAKQAVTTSTGKTYFHHRCFCQHHDLFANITIRKHRSANPPSRSSCQIRY